MGEILLNLLNENALTGAITGVIAFLFYGKFKDLREYIDKIDSSLNKRIDERRDKIYKSEEAVDAKLREVDYLLKEITGNVSNLSEKIFQKYVSLEVKLEGRIEKLIREYEDGNVEESFKEFQKETKKDQDKIRVEFTEIRSEVNTLTTKTNELSTTLQEVVVQKINKTDDEEIMRLNNLIGTINKQLENLNELINERSLRIIKAVLKLRKDVDANQIWIKQVRKKTHELSNKVAKVRG